MKTEQLFQDFMPPRLARRLRRSRLPRVGARPLNKLDRQLRPILPEKGTFIEIGANDGLNQSNTWWLERDRGWHGLLIEPALNRFLELTKNRSSKNFFFCAACVPLTFEGDFVEMVYADLMSTSETLDLVELSAERHLNDAVGHAPTQVKFLASARPMSCLIEESGIGNRIDFLSLDVEGAELAVLKGIDFAKHSISYILVESRDVEKVRAFLTPFGYGNPRQLSFHDYLFEQL